MWVARWMKLRQRIRYSLPSLERAAKAGMPGAEVALERQLVRLHWCQRKLNKAGLRRWKGPIGQAIRAAEEG